MDLDILLQWIKDKLLISFSQILKVHFSNLVKKKSLLLFISDFMSLLWLEKRKHKMYNSILKLELLLMISKEEEEINKTLMKNIDKKSLEENLIKNLKLSLNHVMRLFLLKINSNLKFLEENMDLMEHLSKLRVFFNLLRHVWWM